MNPEPWFAYAGGIKIVAPAFPSDAKGLMKSAVRDDNPVLYLEHKWIYRRIKEEVPTDADFLVPIGEADVKREGTDVSIITYGAHGAQVARGRGEPRAARGLGRGHRPAHRAAHRRGDGAELDRQDVARARGERESTGSWASAPRSRATIAEKAFEHLDAPVTRLSPPNMPVPFSPPLEDAFLPQVADIERAVEGLSAW